MPGGAIRAQRRANRRAGSAPRAGAAPDGPGWKRGPVRLGAAAHRSPSSPPRPPVAYKWGLFVMSCKRLLCYVMGLCCSRAGQADGRTDASSCPSPADRVACGLRERDRPAAAETTVTAPPGTKSKVARRSLALLLPPFARSPVSPLSPPSVRPSVRSLDPRSSGMLLRTKKSETTFTLYTVC